METHKITKTNMNIRTNKARKLNEIIKELKSLMLYTNNDSEDRTLLRALTYLSKALRLYNKPFEREKDNR